MEQHGDAATERTSVLSTKLLRTALCQRRPALHQCGDPDRSQTTGLTFAGSLNHLIQIGILKYACMVLFYPTQKKQKTLGLRPTDQSSHHETWVHLDFVDWRNTQSHHEEPDRRILLKEPSTPYHYGQQIRRISDIMSDHSLSS